MPGEKRHASLNADVKRKFEKRPVLHVFLYLQNTTVMGGKVGERVDFKFKTK